MTLVNVKSVVLILGRDTLTTLLSPKKGVVILNATRNP